MKNLSIRLKITLWFGSALIIVVALTLIIVFSVSNSVMIKDLCNNLSESVEHNVDEVEFYSTFDEIHFDNDSDHYIAYNNGYIEIDDDFLDRVNGISTSLCESDGSLLYGENPIAVHTVSQDFSDYKIQAVSARGETYYIYDRMLTLEGLEGLWLRGIVPEAMGKTQLSYIVNLSLVLLPILILISILGGYIIAGKTLYPIKKISLAAAGINHGQDLKKRIEIGNGKDELHYLANTFNEMLERLELSFKAQKQFTSDASHELRTPITVIMAQCEFALSSASDSEDYRNALIVIQRQGHKMSRLINNMLDFTRLENKSESYAIEKINLSDLVSSVCEDMSLINEKSITLTFSTDDNIYVMGNSQLLSRLIANLISNSYRYGNENGHINVTLTSSEETASLSVADDGIGISKEQQPQIFNRFYQADSSHSGEGAGLGLAMVKEIAAFHGGSITVESEPEKGSIFTFIIKTSN